MNIPTDFAEVFFLYAKNYKHGNVTNFFILYLTTLIQ